MAEITLRQAALWCGGRVEEKYADVTFLGANMDSRKIQPGQLFIALQGQRDGHEFIPMAMEKGAAAVLCSRPCGDIPAIIVEDPRQALGEIARHERRRIGMKVVGITGSVSVSGSREMMTPHAWTPGWRIPPSSRLARSMRRCTVSSSELKASTSPCE